VGRLKEKIEKALMMIAVISIFLSSFPPIPTKGAAGVIEIGSGVNILVDAIQAISGITMTMGPGACVCVKSWWELKCLPNNCPTAMALSNAELTERLLELRHADTVKAINAIDATPALSSILDQTKQIMSEVEYLGGAIIMKPPPPPPPNRSPGWDYFMASAMTVPFLFLRSDVNDLEEIIKDYGKVVEETMKQKGYFFCPESKTFKLKNEPQAPHPLLMGYCSLTGLPIIEVPNNPNTPPYSTMFNAALDQHAMPSFIFNGDEWKAIIGETIFDSSLRSARLQITINGQNPYNVNVDGVVTNRIEIVG